MGLGGLYADAEGDGDFLAALAFREELNDFAFARSEAVASGSSRLNRSGTLGEVVEEHVGRTSGEEGAVIGKSFDGVDEIAVGVGLHDVGASARLDDVLDQLVREMERENNDAGLGEVLADAA